jgi:transposase InsO family protein
MLEAVAKTESPSELTSFGRILPSIEDACEKMDYNTRRPHSALANLPPAAFAASAMRREGKQQPKMEPLPAQN